MSAAAKTDGQESLADDFWRYSAKLYGRPGISDECLRLQDEAGVDVNLLLFCCWAGFRAAKVLDTEDIHQLLDATHDWREGVIKPIRSLRRELKLLTGKTEGSGFVYDAIKRCELDAEKVKQRLLIGAAGPLENLDSQISDTPRIALANIETYFAKLGVEEEDWVKTAVTGIINMATDLANEKVQN